MCGGTRVHCSPNGHTLHSSLLKALAAHLALPRRQLLLRFTKLRLTIADGSLHIRQTLLSGSQRRTRVLCRPRETRMGQARG